jgi:hypothetical protein
MCDPPPCWTNEMSAKADIDREKKKNPKYWVTVPWCKVSDSLSTSTSTAARLHTVP